MRRWTVVNNKQIGLNRMLVGYSQCCSLGKEGAVSEWSLMT